MPRIARVVIPDVPHHVTQRGNNRQDVFFVDDDRQVYLKLLKEQSDRFDLQVLGYCLMTTHVHIVATPRREESLAKAVGRTHLLYTQYINRLHRRSGHLWQNRFHSCPLDDDHLWRAVCYVERNPVRAKMVRRAWDYAWSSAGAHVGGVDPFGVLDLTAWEEMVGEVDWVETLSGAEDEDGLGLLRVRTRTGRPLGSDGFLSKVELAVGRRLRPLPVGRPRKCGRDRVSPAKRTPNRSNSKARKR